MSKGPEPSEVVEDHSKDHRGQGLDRELRHREIRRAEKQKRERHAITSNAQGQTAVIVARARTAEIAPAIIINATAASPGRTAAQMRHGAARAKQSAPIVSNAAASISTST